MTVTSKCVAIVTYLSIEMHNIVREELHLLRVMMLSTLSGLLYHSERIAHSDGSSPTYVQSRDFART
jgi:hypothetical protein